jgi:hypothetical protein
MSPDLSFDGPSEICEDGFRPEKFIAEILGKPEISI